MTSDTKGESFIAALTFPISSFIYILLHPDSKSFKLIFVMFFAFVGGAVCLGSMGGADVATYASYFRSACNMRNVGFFEYFHSRPSAQQIDYYSSFMLWLVSRFTSNHSIYLGISAAIMAVFFSNNISYVVKHIELTKVNILLIAVLALVPQFIFVTHRWWTAMQIFLYGLLPVVVEKKYKSIIWCAVSAFVVHFSFIYPLFVLIVAVVLPQKRLWLFLALYTVTLLMNSFNFDLLSPVFEVILPEETAGRTETYINYELLEHNFLSQSAGLAMKVASVLLCYWMLIRHRILMRENTVLRSLFVVSLLLGSFTNLASLTEWGWRYSELSNSCLIMLYIFFFSAKANDYNCTRVFRFISPLFIYFIIYQIRGFLDVLGPLQIMVGNYFTMWFIEDENTVLELIKSVL